MNTRQRFGLAALLVVLSAAAGILAWPDLPAEMATHWNAAGTPDDTMPKPVAISLLPSVSALLLGLLAVLPRADPMGENVEAFRAAYDWFAVLLAGVLGVVHVGVVAYNLGYRFPFVSLVLVAVAGLLYVAGLVLERTRPNWIVGIRTPWTLASGRVWDRTHALGAPLFKLTALSTLLGAVFPEYAVVLLLGPLLITLAVTIGYSYWLYQRLEGDGDDAEPE